MAALGAIDLRPSFPPPQAEKLLIGHYNIIRGRFLGSISQRNPARVRPAMMGPLDSYTVRQIRVLFRQLWPARGQRFPQ